MLFIVSLTCNISSEEISQDFFNYLHSVSCFVKSSDGTGTGLFISKTNGNTYVLTAAHVVEDARKLFSSKFDRIKIQAFVFQDYIKVGLKESDAEVIRYSSNKVGQDLALLRLCQKNFTTNSAKFYMGDEKDIRVGKTLIHLGNFEGEYASYSFSQGNLSHKGRVINNRSYWQTTIPIYFGSSGGGIFNFSQECVGIVTRRFDSTLNLCIPINRVRDFAKTNDCEWIFNEDCSKINDKFVEDKYD